MESTNSNGMSGRDDGADGANDDTLFHPPAERDSSEGSTLVSSGSSSRRTSGSSSEYPLQEIVVRSGEQPHPLTLKEVRRLRQSHGRNVAIKKSHVSWPVIFLHSVIHPFNLILITLAVIAIVLHDYATAVLMAIMVSIGVSLRFYQDLKSEVAAEALLSLIETHATVVRVDEQGKERVQRVSMEDVVPGDIVKLSAGDMIPGDIRLLKSKDLYISQAALTGESLPVMKSYDTSLRPSRPASRYQSSYNLTEEIKKGDKDGIERE